MNLSLLVHTFNRYAHLWDGCYTGHNLYTRLQAVNMRWGTDVEGECEINHPFKMIYSGTGEWSDRLIKLLSKIDTDYVLYCQEDHWPTKPPPNLVKMMQIMTEKDLFRLQISPVVHFYNLFSEENTLFFDVKSKYLVSHQPSIWKKSFLLDCLKPGETPWLNEYKGTLRLQQSSQMREYVHKKIAIYPYDWYKHMCVKGKVIAG